MAAGPQSRTGEAAGLRKRLALLLFLAEKGGAQRPEMQMEQKVGGSASVFGSPSPSTCLGRLSVLQNVPTVKENRCNRGDG